VTEYTNDRNTEQLFHFADCWQDPKRIPEWRKKQVELDRLAEIAAEEKRKRKALRQKARMGIQ
jgi:hypothetical protein